MPLAKFSNGKDSQAPDSKSISGEALWFLEAATQLSVRSSFKVIWVKVRKKIHVS